ncbi:DUF4345 domain-containing protein [Mycobacterium sp. 852013-50091_SCH5140682]|uniref:DUF4345 family protein n=1 Tax=Mycobacterium sp. 852013-50091_SCH5140682 TaxID=1834109 RepID=UPI0007EA16B8|nr:DUF4345 family protein [Mycobacterium sp. 852013-50091_SCH5140682]OBC08149.1 DUF4345 domain-containing protein [Mycobacterium sp. 852013-50091_SCH5140682]
MVVIVAVGVFFAGMGLYAMAAPTALLRPFGLVPGQSTARAEVRAVYGGFGLAMAAILGYAAVTSGQLRTGIVITVAAALAGMALGRIISGVIDVRTSFYPNWFYCLVEAGAAAALMSVA